MRVLVTGGTGYLWAAIVRALRRADHRAVVLARSRAAAPSGIDTPVPRSLPSRLVGVLAAIDEARARVTGQAPRMTRGVADIFSHDWPIDSTAALAYAVQPFASTLSSLLPGAGWR